MDDETTRWLRRLLDAGLPLPPEDVLADFPDELPPWDEVELTLS